MSNSEDTALRLIGMVYDSAMDERKWPSFLQAFAQTVNSNSVTLRLVDFQIEKVGFTVHVGSYTPAMQAAYASYYIKLDYYSKFYNHAPLMSVATDQTGERWGIGSAIQRKTEYFNDFISRNGHEYAMGTVLARNDNQTLHFATQRSKCAGEFGAEQERLMSILAPHVSRAVQVHRKIGALTTEKESAHSALDQLRMGVILTDSSGMPLFVNRAAEQMLTQGAGIGIFHNRLALSTLAETALLHQLISGAAQRSKAVGGDMRIALPDKHAFLHCLVTPVAQEFAAQWKISAESNCVAIFLSRPGSLALSPLRLVALYKLTPAEARLAAKLAAFLSVDQAADDLGISVLTARSQLRNIFAKTGAKGQPELLMLLATGTLAHCREG